MQRKRVYNVSLYFDLHVVSCPGVWLCPKGNVAVRVAIFGVAETTKMLPPTFPLAFNERFHFEKKYRKASNLHQVEKSLGRSTVCLDLLQYPQGKSAPAVKLAEFRACVSDIIYPPGGDLDLLFCPKETFPGIIAPKAEVSTRLLLTECGANDSNVPTTILSKVPKVRPIEKPLVRQKPVCHTKHNLYCSCFCGKGAQPSTIAIAANRRKEIRRTSLEKPRLLRPAHKLSHLNHGDALPGSEEMYNCQIERCSCTKQSGFQNAYHLYPRCPSQSTSMSEETVKDGLSLHAYQQPLFVGSRANSTDKKNKKEPLESKGLKNVEDNEPCCLCCPNAANRSSVLKNKYEMKRNKVEYWSGPEKDGEKKLSARASDHSYHTQIDPVRKMPKEGNARSDDQNLLYSNIRKGYMKILRDYFTSGEKAPGVH